MGRALSAAAAAAEDREVDDSRRIYADAAAVAALGFAVSLVRGWTGGRCLLDPPNMAESEGGARPTAVSERCA